MSDFPLTIAVLPTIQDDVDDVLAADQNTPNNEITAIETLIGTLGVSQANSLDIMNALMNLLPTITLSWVDIDTLQASAGYVSCKNSGETIRVLRRNTVTTNITFANIDTGARALSTQYYVWAIADAANTTITFKISTSSSAPTGSSIYRLIGKFRTDGTGSGQIMNQSIKNEAYFSLNLGRQTAQAWAVINVSGGTPSIVDSFNISSITDNGTGDFTLNFITPFSSVNYCAIGSTQSQTNPATGAGSVVHHTFATTSYRFKIFNSADTAIDAPITCVAFFGAQ